MNPSPDAITAIRAEVADWNQTDEAIATALNAPSVDNPQSQTNVAPPFNFDHLISCVTTEEITRVKEYPTTQRLFDDVDNQAHLNVARWASMSMLSGDISPESGQKVIALVTTPVPDPDYQASISWAVANLGRAVDVEDIHAAREANDAGN